MTISMTTYIKDGNKWREHSTTTDRAKVYENLANDLIYKKLLGSTSITSIKQKNNYDGTRTIDVYTNNGCKYHYIV